jgi:hypothetical protein
MESYTQDPGARFLSDYQERNPLYFSDSNVWNPDEERVSDAMRIGLANTGVAYPLYGRETITGPDGGEKERSFGLFSKGMSRSTPARETSEAPVREGMVTSATQDLNQADIAPSERPDPQAYTPEEEHLSKNLRKVMSTFGGMPLFGKETMRGPGGSEKERTFGLFG